MVVIFIPPLHTSNRYWVIEVQICLSGNAGLGGIAKDHYLIEREGVARLLRESHTPVRESPIFSNPHFTLTCESY